MPEISIADQTFVAAPAADVAARLEDRTQWKRWWPALDLTVTEDRGPVGIRWGVSGAVHGTMEWWLEPALDGVVVHYFLHGDRANPAGSATDIVRELRITAREVVFATKFAVEGGRAAGEPAATK